MSEPKAELQLEKIPRSIHRDVMHSFWTMMGECEALADRENDATLKTQVEGWMRQWNRITGDTKIPRWIERASR